MNGRNAGALTALQGLYVGYGGNKNILVGISWLLQEPLLERSYADLKDSLYQALLPQTRLKPYLDAVNYSVDANGLQVDFSGVLAANDASFDLFERRVA